MNEPFWYQIDEGNIDDQGHFTGYAAIYGSVDKWGRICEPGCFDAVLARFAAEGRYPAILWEHNKKLVIGRQTLESDEKGLAVDGQLYIGDADGVLALEDAKRAYNLILKSQYGLSFRAPFLYANASATMAGLRISKYEDIRETSIVAHPAQNNATVEAVASAPTMFDIDKRLTAWLGRLG